MKNSFKVLKLARGVFITFEKGRILFHGCTYAHDEFFWLTQSRICTTSRESRFVTPFDVLPRTFATLWPALSYDVSLNENVTFQAAIYTHEKKN